MIEANWFYGELNPNLDFHFINQQNSHYGALQGFNKDTAWQELGLDQELVMQMRRSYDVRPPRMEDTHEFWHGNDRRYVHLVFSLRSEYVTESLMFATRSFRIGGFGI